MCAREEHVLLLEHLDAHDVLVVAFERLHNLPARQVPNFERLVVRRRDDTIAVHLQVPHRARVP